MSRELEDRVLILEKQLKGISEKVENEDKDFWDKLGVISSFMSGVVVSFLAIIFLYVNNDKSLEIQSQLRGDNKERHEREMRQRLRESEMNELHQRNQKQILELQAVEKFIPHIRNENTRTIAIEALLIMDYGDIAYGFSRLYGDYKLQSHFYSKQVPDAQKGSLREAERVKAVESEKVLEGQTTQTGTTNGWVYLGRLKNGKWLRAFCGVSKEEEATNLVGEILKVEVEDGVILVREKVPEDGVLSKAKFVLNPGSSMRVSNVLEEEGGHIWAQVLFRVE